MNITFLGAAREVTGSRTLVEVCGRRILVDCGMEQGSDTYENRELPVSAGEIDCVVLTHAHIDHSGMLPALVRQGFRGKIFSTGATAELCSIMLMDSARIQESEAEWRTRKALRAGLEPYEPVYTSEDVSDTLQKFVKLDYNEQIGLFDGASLRFIDAGHLLGSASAFLTLTENGETTKLLFSGDIGNVDRPLIRNPEKPSEADVVVIESTYGDRLHGPRGDYASEVTEIIQSTLDRGGNVVIPAFAVGRTQELLYLIREIKQKGLVKNHDGFQVWVDSPLAIEATKIYSGGLRSYYDADTLALLSQGVDPLNFDGLHVSVTSEESKAINEDPTPKVILSASGMCEAGRIRHHLKHNLWRAESTILFVGYQSEGTLGRALLDGETKIRLFGEDISVRARIATMDGVSGHADRDMLLGWLSNVTPPPRRVFVNHGEDEVAASFAALITEKLGCPAVAPYNGAKYDLVSLDCLEQGNTKRIEKTSDVREVKTRTSAAFERLMSAVKRLSDLAASMRARPNKDIAKLTDQITSIVTHNTH